jgi:excisionase family DNA binding protein
VDHLPDQLAYSPEQAARALGISRTQLYRYMRDGSLPSVKLGKSRRIRREALLALLDNSAAA